MLANATAATPCYGRSRKISPGELSRHPVTIRHKKRIFSRALLRERNPYDCFAESLARGEANRKKIALTTMSDRVRETI